MKKLVAALLVVVGLVAAVILAACDDGSAKRTARRDSDSSANGEARRRGDPDSSSQGHRQPQAKVGDTQPSPIASRQKAPWKPYNFRLRRGANTRWYNLATVVHVPDRATPDARLLLDVQNNTNYYFVQLTDRAVCIGKVEIGVEAERGTRAPHGLTVGARNRIVVKRRRNTIEVVLNDRVVAWAEDESFHGGHVGWGSRQGATITKLSVQPCMEIHREDDFMRAEQEGDAWEKTPPGAFRVETLRNPSLSSNAFYYVGSAPLGAQVARAVRGQWFWDNYRARVACASSGTRDVGLCVYYRDEQNHYVFRWNAERQPDGTRGRRQLVKLRHGRETVLAEAPGGYQPEIWYELEAEVVGDRIRTFIDGHQVFSLTDPNLCFGKAGIVTATRAQARFDDFIIQTVRAFEDDFSELAAGRWRVLRGAWEQRSEGNRHLRVVSANEPAKAVAGSSRWSDHTLTAIARLPATLGETSEAGLVGHYLDETNYALFAWRPAAGTARLEAVADGKRTALEEVRAPTGLPSSRHRLRLTWSHNVVTAQLDGHTLASAWVPKLPRGKVGLYAAAVSGLAFENARVQFPLRRQPVLTTNEVFSRESSMEIWAGAARDWESTRESIQGRSVSANWHRADFFGDATIELDIKDPAARSAPGLGAARKCHLILSGEPHELAARRRWGTTRQRGIAGYRFVLTWPTGSRRRTEFQAAILRHGQTVAARTVALNTAPQRLSFRRLGRHLIASVDNDQALAYQDPQPLGGHRAAYATEGLAVPKTQVRVFSDTVQVYTFSRASTAWRPAAGRWEISNRWQCDPRWSFFSGVPRGASRLAALWNKNIYDGDLSVEFAVGPKMERERGGSYQYARDFNVTIAADGNDLDTGYSFIYGGWDDSYTAITRRGKVVKRTSHRIRRSSSIHRRWFYIKVEKIGPTLTYSIDGQPILTYTDPAPLPGRQVAIWSWDCGIMVSRVRISASRILGTEPPGLPRGRCHTIYSRRR